MSRHTFKADIGNGLILNVEKGMYGLEEKSGKTLLPPIYEYISTPVGKLIYVTDVDGCEGVVSLNGTEVVPPVYDQVTTMKHSIIKVCKDFLWGAFNTEGEMLIPIIYDDVIITSSKKCIGILEGKQISINFT